MSGEAAAWRLDRFAINVGDLGAAVRFYCEALGFVVEEDEAPAPALARLLGVAAARVVALRRGRQVLELCACDPVGAPIPRDSRSNDVWFQHCALVSSDIEADYARLRASGATPISRDGPQMLPGGIVAFKFRDPEYHPLELISFPAPDARTVGGIDHSAISVGDTARSIAFYKDVVGFGVASRQLNRGAAQDALDNLNGATADVVALAVPEGAPHVELLGYRAPIGRSMAVRANDIAATRMIFKSDQAAPRALLHDPDGHAIDLIGSN